MNALLLEVRVRVLLLGPLLQGAKGQPQLGHLRLAPLLGPQCSLLRSISVLALRFWSSEGLTQA